MSFLALESVREPQGGESDWKNEVAKLMISEWEQNFDAQKVFKDPQTKDKIMALLSDAYEWHLKVKSRVLYLDFEPTDTSDVSDVKVVGLHLKSRSSSGNGLVDEVWQQNVEVA
jgi:hypothetical protein